MIVSEYALEDEHFASAKEYYLNLSYIVDITFHERVHPGSGGGGTAGGGGTGGGSLSPAQQQNMWSQTAITLNINTKWTVAKVKRRLLFINEIFVVLRNINCI